MGQGEGEKYNCIFLFHALLVKLQKTIIKYKRGGMSMRSVCVCKLTF